MTAPKVTLRQRRGGSARLSTELVADLEQWFAGAQPSAWVMLLPGHEDAEDEIGARWRQWHKDRPGPIPPHVAEWLEQKK